MNNRQVIHDFLMEHRPDGTEHDALHCSMCKQQASEMEEDVSSTETLLTQEQHETLVASAVEKAVAEAKQAGDLELVEANKTIEAHEAKIASLTEELESLKAMIAERDEAERLEAKASERAARVEAYFSDEQIAQRRESWAKMDDADFAAYVEDIEAVAKAKLEDNLDSKVPASDFDGTRETAGKTGTERSVIAEFFGVDAGGA